MPDGTEQLFERSVQDVVTVPKAVKPHPYGVELGILLKMAKDSQQKTMTSFLQEEFSRISERVSQEILKKAKLSARMNPHTLTHTEAEKLHQVINEIKIMAPSTSCVVPIGEEELLKGLQQVVKADFYKTCTRPPAVYRGNPFQIEVGLSYGGGGSGNEEDDFDEGPKNGSQKGEQELMRVLRFANRVPLLYQQSACAVFKSILQTNWRLYGLSQSRGALPAGPVTVIVHIASVWVPFTSESKEAVAHYPEIIKEIKLALSECGRALGRFLRGVKKQRDEALKRSYIEKYLPAIGEALRDILTLKEAQVQKVLTDLEYVLEQSRGK
jgi:DNA topoisomerase-6 subunit B